MEKSRFSMLLLEPGEIYYEDYACKYKLSTDIDGRLKICSKSLVFEPKSWSHPLLKMQYRDIKSLDIPQNGKEYIELETRSYAEMLEGNIISAYKFKYERKIFLFEFEFTTADVFLPFIMQLKRASTLHAAEQNSMISTISFSKYCRSEFETMMMDDFTEEICLQLSGERITPLVRNPGKIVLTPTTLYFQPYNNIESTPVIKLKAAHMKRVYKRRFLLKQVGLEIYFNDNSSTPHIYLSFHNEEDRNNFYDVLNQSACIDLEKVHFEEMTVQWQNGVVSNYDYLIYLNCLADRSKNDLSQYPVFPWVISDYTSNKLDLHQADAFRDLSKPMGALNLDRLAKLKERYDEMSEPKFLYGSHYSAPALVLFYLVRKYPHYMLCLQNGRFDHPDRMFNSVADVYKNCLNNLADFKELIPEFYDIESGPDIFVNTLCIDFGFRDNGARVNNVKLPPWAKDNHDFVKILRDALESEYVSRHLHLWIDLIFGYKQRGEEAVKANNVFHYVSYEGSVDLDQALDLNERYALEVQIMEFGQIPKQLFDRPHVRRIMSQVPRMNRADYSLPIELELCDVIKSHKDEVMDIAVSEPKIVSVARDGTLKVFCMAKRQQTRSVNLSSMSLSCCVVINRDVVAVGSCDNQIYVYDTEFGRVLGSFRAHDDSVTCLLWLQKETLLISGGCDCVVRVWSNVHEGGIKNAFRGLKAEFEHEAKIIGIEYRQNTSAIISVTEDGDVYSWDISSKTLSLKTSLQSGPIQTFSLLHGDRIVVATLGGEVSVTDVGLEHCILKKKIGEPITCMRTNDNTLWLCSVYGTIYQWDMNTFNEVDSTKIHDDKITSVYLNCDENQLITASADCTVKIWQLKNKLT